jgi:hypothetical protein
MSTTRENLPAQALDASNSLADLAARIRAEHEASAIAMQRGLEHAINAGRLLIEAKAQLKHGQWLPWLAEHCEVSERTASLYMRLARHAPELEAKAQPVADLTVRGALELLAPPPSAEPDWDDWDSISEWADRQLDGPFTPFDFPADDDDRRFRERYDWLETKLRHQVGLPWTVDWCFSITDATEDGRPALRLCPYDDLFEAAKALAPIANGTRALKFDFPDMAAMRGAIVVVELETLWMLGGLLNEMKYREHLSDERYEREWAEIYARVMARLDAAFQNQATA